jgi:glucose 1-dehydrogenase
MTGERIAAEEDWSREVALVTGGSGDIGADIVEALLARGARVASADLRLPAQLIGKDRNRRDDLVDVTDQAAVESWVASVAESWGPPSVLIVAAGISHGSRLLDTTRDEWRSVLSTCLDAAFYTARAAINQMLDGGVRGRVVFVGSWAAHAPHPHVGSYSVAKAGLRALAQTLALDHAADGILVNEVAPGIVEAGLSKALLDRDPALKARTMTAIPIGAALVPADVTRDVLHLCSPANRSTTGAVLVSDGGLSIASTMNPGGIRG